MRCIMAYKSRAKRLAEALVEVESGQSEIACLQEEIESWQAGMEGTNLENTEKYSQLGDCIDSLEEVVGLLQEAIDFDVEFPGMY